MSQRVPEEVENDDIVDDVIRSTRPLFLFFVGTYQSVVRNGGIAEFLA